MKLARDRVVRERGIGAAGQRKGIAPALLAGVDRAQFAHGLDLDIVAAPAQRHGFQPRLHLVGLDRSVALTVGQLHALELRTRSDRPVFGLEQRLEAGQRRLRPPADVVELGPKQFHLIAREPCRRKLAQRRQLALRQRRVTHGNRRARHVEAHQRLKVVRISVDHLLRAAEASQRGREPTLF